MKKTGTDPCDRAYNILTCYIKSSQEMFRRQREQAMNEQQSSHTMPRVSPKQSEDESDKKQEL